MGKVITMRSGDEAARERIRTSLDESLIVEAAAGTGKTTELISRIVTGFRTGKIRNADNLVAVTFTRKAAGELKLRLRGELDRALEAARKAADSNPQTQTSEPRSQQRENLSSRDKVRRAGEKEALSAEGAALPDNAALQEVRNLEGAIAYLEEAHIGTIHSFCAEILRERPVEANVDPAFRELSDHESQRLYRQAFRRWSQEKLSASPPGLRRCLSRLAARSASGDSSPLEEVQHAGWSLIQWRDFSKPWERRAFEREPAIDAVVRQIFELADLISRCPRAGDELVQSLRPVRDLTTWIERAEAARGKPNERDYDALEGRLLIVLSELRKRAKTGRGKFAEDITREQVIRARDAVVQSIETFKRQADADLAALLQAEMRDLITQYDETKRKAGSLDFVDLLIKARDLIREDHSVRTYLQKKFTHIFVDEFQDTDPLQTEILVLLAAEDPEETDWLEVRPQPGKLFLVGDPKQSVYRFRRADLVLYQQLRDALATRGVSVVHLKKSYRSFPSLQECINAAFATVMIEDRTTGQAGYVPLERERDEVDDQPTVVALPVPEPYGQNDVTRWAIDKSLPVAVAGYISWLINDSGWKVWEGKAPVRIQPKHICILFRRFVTYHTDVTRDYLRELEAHAVPHLLVGGKSFHSREEIVTLRAALSAIEWPDDELAVFATLKGSLFAIRDDVLLRFRSEFHTLNPFRPLPDSLNEDFQPVAEALRILARLHRGRNWRPVVATVNELLETTRAHAGFALRPAGNQALANVYRVCDMARTFESTGGISFRGFVEDLAQQAEREESPEAPVLEEGSDGVRIMTVHTAKGLEFPVVVLADITAKLARQEPDMYVDSASNLCAMRLVSCSPWDLLEHEQEERDRDMAEGVRVAYVASTRARDLLVVPAVGDGPYEGWLSPLNRVIYPAAGQSRDAEKAPHCPDFGDDTVLERPTWYDEPPQFSVKPGMHRPELGNHRVVWWDPRKLPKSKTTNFGVRQQEILARDSGGKSADESTRLYREWKDHKLHIVERGKEPKFNLFVVSDIPELPKDFEAKIEVQVVEKAGRRPHGARFGSLVHAVLSVVDLAGSTADITALVRVHGRVLGCPAEEVAAAIETVSATLNHPLLVRARDAARRHREFPIAIAESAAAPDEGRRMVEGTLDLAFLEGDTWNVVDFKTDAVSPLLKPSYVRQLQWYVYAMARVTGAPVQGWLLSL